MVDGDSVPVGRGEGGTRSALACGAGSRGIVPGLFPSPNAVVDPLRVREGPRKVVICLWRGFGYGGSAFHPFVCCFPGHHSSATRKAARGPV